MIEITKDTIIGDILDVAPQTAPIFLSIGMHCLGCPSSRGETVEEACMVHGVDCEKLLALVNEEVWPCWPAGSAMGHAWRISVRTMRTCRCG